MESTLGAQIMNLWCYQRKVWRPKQHFKIYIHTSFEREDVITAVCTTPQQFWCKQFLFNTAFLLHLRYFNINPWEIFESCLCSSFAQLTFAQAFHVFVSNIRIYHVKKSLITFCPQGRRCCLLTPVISQWNLLLLLLVMCCTHSFNLRWFTHFPQRFRPQTLFSSMRCQHSVFLNLRRSRISRQDTHPFRGVDWSFLFIIPSVEHLHTLMFISLFETRNQSRNWLFAHICTREAEQNGTEAGGELCRLAIQPNSFADI